MKSTFKSHGKTYDIKQVGDSTRNVKAHTDFNGYDSGGGKVTSPRYGVFDGAKQVGKVVAGRDVIIHGDKHGSV
jgi:hypothetical protein